MAVVTRLERVYLICVVFEPRTHRNCYGYELGWLVLNYDLVLLNDENAL